MVHLIDIDDDKGRGSVSGYVVEAKAEQLGNWLEEFTDDAKRIAEWVKENCHVLAIGKNFYVEEKHRNRGIGSDLFNEFLSEAKGRGADIIVMISDSAEKQQEGFTLQNWYESYDFCAVTATNAGSFMVFPPEVAEKMKVDLFAPKRPRPKV